VLQLLGDVLSESPLFPMDATRKGVNVPLREAD
jgi:hypothetical protein